MDLEQVMGVEPTSSAWKADALTVVLHLQMMGPNGSQGVLAFPSCPNSGAGSLCAPDVFGSGGVPLG